MDRLEVELENVGLAIEGLRQPMAGAALPEERTNARTIEHRTLRNFPPLPYRARSALSHGLRPWTPLGP